MAERRKECPSCARQIRACNMARHRKACDRLRAIITELDATSDEHWRKLKERHGYC